MSAHVISFLQAVLGISLAPQDTLEHPNVPLLNAGTRRQNACTALFDKRTPRTTSRAL